jgi:hypothetical protein
MTYKGVEKRQRASTPEEQFEQDIDGLTRRVLKENINLDKIRVDEGVEREKIVQAVQQRVIQLFAKIELEKKTLGDTSLLPAIRKRLRSLFNLQDGQLGTSEEMVDVVPPSSVNISPSNKKRTLQEHIERELFFFGKLYLFCSENDFFETAKEAVLSKFIIRCSDERQQEDVVKIVNNFEKSDLSFVGMSNEFSIIQINPEVLDQLNIASLLTKEDYRDEKHSGTRLKRCEVVDLDDIDDGWDDAGKGSGANF